MGLMGFTVTDFADLLRLLEQHPEWKSALRTALLGEGFLELPELVRRLAASQQRAQEELAALAAEVRALAEAQRRTDERIAELVQAQRQSDERLTRLEQAVAQLAEAQRQTEQRIAQLAHAQQHTDERLTRLEQAVAQLAEAQRQTEQRIAQLAQAQQHTEERLTRLEQAVAQLAEAQRQTEQRIAQLAQAQQHTEERLTRLEQVVADLAEAQRRSEDRLRRLEEAQQVTNLRLGRLEEFLGLTVEEHAEEVLLLVLEEKGLRVVEGPHSVPVDGEGQVDLAAVCEDPAGLRVTVLVESKVRLSASAVRRWADRVASEGFRRKLEQAGLPGPYLAYAFGFRVDRPTEKAARERGVGVLSGRGEVVAPAGLIP
jgi:DNA repair ATPase RecN